MPEDPAFTSMASHLSHLQKLSVSLMSVGSEGSASGPLSKVLEAQIHLRRSLNIYILSGAPPSPPLETLASDLDSALTTSLPPPLLKSLLASSLLPLSPAARRLLPPVPLSATDMHEAMRLCEVSALMQELGKDPVVLRQLPPGHTVFSWFGGTTDAALPPGHTAYTFAGFPECPLNCLLKLLTDVRKVERSKAFAKMLLSDTLATLKESDKEYTKDNFSYGTTPFQSYLSLSSSPCFAEAVSLSLAADSRPLVLGSSLGLFNFYMAAMHGAKSVGIELLPVLHQRSRKLASKYSFKEHTEFVNADFMSGETDSYFEQTNLVVLTSMCWDPLLKAALYSKLARLLKHGCVVVDYTKELASAGGELVEFEEVGEVVVGVSWSDSQKLHVFVKRDINRGIIPVTPGTTEMFEREEEKVEAAAENAWEMVPEKVTETPPKTPPRTPPQSNPSSSPLSPAATAVGVAAGVGIVGYVLNRFWRKSA